MESVLPTIYPGVFGGIVAMVLYFPGPGFVQTPSVVSSGIQLSGQVVVILGYRVVLLALPIVHPINASNKIRIIEATPKTIK